MAVCDSFIDNEVEEELLMCRICFSGVEDGEFIHPCKCKGTRKHIHMNCLNKWRMLSTNRTAYSQCMECKYIYRTIPRGDNNIKKINICCYNCQKKITENVFATYFIHYFLFVMLANLILFIDTDEKILKLLGNENTSNKLEIYFFFTMITYIIIYSIFILYSYASFNNKVDYNDQCLRFSKYPTCPWVLLIIISGLVNLILCSMLLFVTFQIMIYYHYSIINRLSEIETTEILNYEEEQA